MKTVLVVALLLFLPDTSRRRSDEAVRGFLVSVSGEGVLRFDRDGKQVWQHKCEPYDARELKGGRVLITERSAGRVMIVDAEGKVVWEKMGLSSPTDAELVSNGNVLVLENGANRAVEVDREGKVVWEVGGLSNPYDVDRLPGGNTIVADSGNNRLVEFDRAGKVVWEKTGLDFPNGVLRLPNGRTVFTTYTRGSVGEVDAKGELLWEHKIEDSVLYAPAAENGAVWVADGKNGRAIKLSRSGERLATVELKKAFVDMCFAR